MPSMERPGETRSWLLPTVLLCCYGFLKELRPSEPFLTPYLLEVKNITEEELDGEVYPVWTYTYMGALIFVFVLTDLLRYKPVIVFEGVAYIGTWALLLWAYGVSMMKLMQGIYALATSTEIAYYSYIFAVVSSDHYQQVSSVTRSSLLAGRFVSAALGQLLISFHVTTYTGLNYISLTFVSIALVISLFLPAVHTSVYFHRDAIADSKTSEPIPYEATSNDSYSTRETVSRSPRLRREQSDHCMASFKKFWVFLWKDFTTCFSNMQLLQWSLWWAFATCGNFQVGNYVQNLWDIILTESESSTNSQDIYNGAVEALSTLLGALSAFLIMFPRANWDKYGELFLGVVSIIDAIVLLIMGLTTNIWVCYSLYVVFRASYQLVVTIATFQIAKHLPMERYALVFGWNTFVALVLESILTLIVVDHRTLALPADTQFLVYGGYFYVLGTAFCFKAVYQAGMHGCRQTFSCCQDNGTCIELDDRAGGGGGGGGGEGGEGGEEGGEGEAEFEPQEGANEIDEVRGGDNQCLVKE